MGSPASGFAELPWLDPDRSYMISCAACRNKPKTRLRRKNSIKGAVAALEEI